jgi:hypothetical protein
MIKLTTIAMYAFAVVAALCGHTTIAQCCNNSAIAIGNSNEDENE